MKGSIICFAGPPGVGKTSLGKSDRARDGTQVRAHLARRHARRSRDSRPSPDLHRRAAGPHHPGHAHAPGATTRCSCSTRSTSSGADFRGDPAAALLEVLDPAQNDTFEDHYLNIPFDLSKVLFIATANVLDSVPRPLLDRMEVIELPDTSRWTRSEIAKKYLLPRQLDDNGIPPKLLKVGDDALRHIIRHYTREAGVREFERKLRRHRAARSRDGSQAETSARSRSAQSNVSDFLGQEEYHSEIARKRPMIGVVTGLAKTFDGGEILFIEAVKMKGHGHLRLTGQLGGVMRESAEAALSYVRPTHLAKAPDKEFFDKYDIHIHVPAGAVPKRRPSAEWPSRPPSPAPYGRPSRNDVAMTGELTLTGQVLAIGGSRTRSSRAHRAGIKTVLFPEANKRDLDEIPDIIKKDLKLIPIHRASEAIDRTLVSD